MNIKTIFQNKVVKNASWLMGGKIVHMLLSFFIGLLTARYLGPSNYGLINYAAAYVSFFAAFCTLGINSIIVKNFVDHPEEEGKTIGTTLVLRMISSMLSSIMIIGIVSIVDKGEPLTLVVVALSTIGVLFQIFDTFNYWFQSRLQSKYTAIATTIAYLVVSAYRVLLLVLGKDVRWFAIASAIDYIVIALFLYYTYRRFKGPKLTFSMAKAKELLASSNSFILAGMMIAIHSTTDRLMLKQMLDESSVGYYALGISICNMFGFVITSIIDSLNPVIMGLHNKDYDAYVTKNKQLYAIVFYVSITASIAICLFADLIILILYGEAYLPAAMPLRVLAWYTAFSYLGGARNAWIVSENKQKYLKYVYFASAVINVGLNFVLIPVLGTVGAATATLVTQISTIFLVPCFINDLKPNTRLMIEAILLKGVIKK